MKAWLRRHRGDFAVLATGSVALVAVVRLLEAFKPSEPHLVPYLEKVKGLSNDDIANKVFPHWVYATATFTALAGPMARVIGLRGVVWLGAAMRVATRFILIYGEGLPIMQGMQWSFGAATGSDVIFGAYIYTLVGHDDYEPVTSCFHAFSLVGHVLAAETSQLMLDVFHTGLTPLFWVAAVSVCIAALLALGLPCDKTPVLVSPGTAHIQQEHARLFGPQGSVSFQNSPAGRFVPQVTEPFQPTLATIENDPPSVNYSVNGDQSGTGRGDLPASVAGDNVNDVEGGVQPAAADDGEASEAEVTPASESKSATESLRLVIPDSSDAPPSEHTFAGVSLPPHLAPSASGAGLPPGLVVSPVQSFQRRSLSIELPLPRAPSPRSCEGLEGLPRTARWVPPMDWSGCRANPWQTLRRGLRHLEEVYAHRGLWLPSLWWVLMLGPSFGFLENYSTVLFDAVDPSQDNNGHVDAAVRATMALAALAATPLASVTRRAGAAVYGWGALLAAAGMGAMAVTNSLAVAYVLTTACSALWQLLLVLLTAHVAALVPEGSYATVFGVNATATLGLQSAMQAVLQAAGLTIRIQFIGVAMMTAIFALGFILVALCFAGEAARTPRAASIKFWEGDTSQLYSMRKQSSGL